MPLQRQVISIPMAGSLDTKTDPNQLPIGKLLELENGFRKRNGEFVKRYGYETLGLNITPSGTLADGRRMAIFGDELNVITNKSMYTYSDDTDNWVLKGPLETLAVNQRTIIANSYQQTTSDSASIGNIAIYAWEDSRASPAQVRYAIHDRSSNSVIVGDSLLLANAQKPRCIGIGSKLFVFVRDNANTRLTAYFFDIENPTTAPSSLTIGNDFAATANADMILFNGAILVAYATTGGAIKLLYVTPQGTLGSGATGYPTTATYSALADKCLTIFARDNNRFNLSYVNSTTGVRHVGFYSNLDTGNLWLADVQLNAEVNVRNITGFQFGNVIHTYWDVDNADKWKRVVNDTHRLISTGAVTPGSGNLKSVSLGGKAFYTDDDGFVPVVFWSTTQPTMFLLRNDGDISAKMLQATSNGETSTTGHLPNVTENISGQWSFTTAIRTRVISENATLFSLLGVAEVSFDYNDLFICDSAKLGENLLITSGYVQCYDGISIFESGFHVYPDHITATEISTGGIYPFANNNDTAQYCVVYEWTDGKGQIHRSAPSIPITVKATNSNRTFTLTIPTLQITDRKGTRADVVIAVYRTTIGTSSGTLFYKVTSSSAPLYNDPSVQTVTFTDQVLSNDAFLKRELLYTTGGVLENIAPPAAKIVARFKNRTFLAGTEDGTIWYSKEHVPGEAVNFVDAFKIKVDDTGGIITSLGELDDKLIIFKANTIFALTGDGPLPTGAQNTFSVPQLIASDVGCVDPYSVVRTRDGLMFKSKKGIYLLDRGLQVQYIGAEVEAWNDLTITSAAVVDDQNQVRFTTAEGRCLVYDLFFKQWYTFTNINAIDSAMWNRKYVFLKTTGEIWRETRDVYVDVDVPIISKYVLALMQFAQVQGFQRIFKINILGDNMGTHGLKIEVGYDFREFYEERFIVYPDSVLFDSVYGDDTVWGEAGTLWGGNYDGVYQFQIRPRQQRCQALKLKVEDFFGSGAGTAGFALSNVTAEVGIEPNVARIAKTKIIAP